jgi:hypothetical protein
MDDILGVDIGKVVVDGRANDRTDTSFFGPNYLQTTAVPGAFEALRQLVCHRFGQNNVHLVSKCGKNIETKTREWLLHKDFYGQTLVREQNVHYCLTREAKAPICKELGITHFIDDNPEVLNYLVGFVPNLYLFNPRRRALCHYPGLRPKVQIFRSWAPLVEELRKGYQEWRHT